MMEDKELLAELGLEGFAKLQFFIAALTVKGPPQTEADYQMFGRFIQRAWEMAVANKAEETA